MKPGDVLVVVFTHPDKMTASAGIKENGWFKTTFPWLGQDGQPMVGQNYFRSVDSYIKILEEAGFIIDVAEGWKIPDEAKSVNEKQYEKYMRYGNLRLVVKAHTPSLNDIIERNKYLLAYNF